MNDDERRIGRGSWARLFASTVVGDEGSREAERGRRLVAEVEELRVAGGELEARVEGCVVTLGAEPVPPRVWAAIARFARGNHRLEAGVEGREQSVHLMHLMEIDWDEPLLPRANGITRACTCDGGGGCAHVAAVAYAVAQEIDADPGVLLRWRGLDAAEPERSGPSRRSSRTRPGAQGPSRRPSRSARSRSARCSGGSARAAWTRPARTSRSCSGAPTRPSPAPLFGLRRAGERTEVRVAATRPPLPRARNRLSRKGEHGCSDDAGTRAIRWSRPPRRSSRSRGAWPTTRSSGTA